MSQEIIVNIGRYQFTQNHRISWNGKDSQGVIKSSCWLLHIIDQESHVIPLGNNEAKIPILKNHMCPRILFEHFLNFDSIHFLNSQLGTVTTCLRRLFPCPATLCVKNLYLLSKLSLPWHPFRPVAWVLPMGTTVPDQWLSLLFPSWGSCRLQLLTLVSSSPAEQTKFVSLHLQKF